MAKFDVIHPVRHDGKHYGRGSTVTMSEKDAAPLLNVSIKPSADGDAPVEGSIASLTKQQLVDYAAERYQLTLNLSFSKAELLDAINAAALKANA